jgi:hypothetical protein
VFDCGTWILILLETHANKLAPKSKLMTLIGADKFGYIFMHALNNVVFCSLNVKFVEDFSPKCPDNKGRKPKCPKVLLRLILSLKTTILMVPSLMTMMHLMTQYASALVDMILHISSQAMQTIVLHHSLPLEVVA